MVPSPKSRECSADRCQGSRWRVQALTWLTQGKLLRVLEIQALPPADRLAPGTPGRSAQLQLIQLILEELEQMLYTAWNQDWLEFYKQSGP